MRARAIQVRWISPPESVSTNFPCFSRSPTSERTSGTRFAMVSLSYPQTSMAKATFSLTVLRARSLKSWNMIPIVLRYWRSSRLESLVISRPASSYISHFLGLIAPIIDLIILVLPLPDAPIRKTNSPLSISRSISRRTLRSRYERVTCENCIRRK